MQWVEVWLLFKFSDSATLMSSKIILDNIMIEKNPTNFTDRIGIQVTFSCIEPIA